MLNLRMRNINVKIGGHWYSITFRTKSLGRVADIRVWKSAENTPNGIFTEYDAEVDRQAISTVQALKMIWRSMKNDITRLLRR